MKRMIYVSRFSRPLTTRDLVDIREKSARKNPKADVTGVLVSLGGTFFQVLEGPEEEVDALYYGRILPDSRHKDVLCLKSESGVKERMFPGWHMKVYDLNADKEVLPLAFREMLSSLLESHHMLAEYTQPSLFKMLEQGINPSTVRPRRRRVTVLYCDIIGFSHFAQHLPAEDFVGLVNSQVAVCAGQVGQHGGEVNKLTGDGVLAYFSAKSSDAALHASLGILKEMRQLRARAGEDSPHRYLYSGVGLSHGIVYEGNVGFDLKRDFTILGHTVNLASRFEAMTRELGVRITMGASVVHSAKETWPFESLGKKAVRGQTRPVEVFTLGCLPPLEVARVYQEIRDFVRR